jgi:Phage Tail Collar Domain
MAKIEIESSPTLARLCVGTILVMLNSERKYVAEGGGIWLRCARQLVSAQDYPALAVVMGAIGATFRLPDLREHTRPPLNYYIKVK